MRSEIRKAIHNAQAHAAGKSTPITLYRAESTAPEQGRNRCALNAFQHGLSGHHMILQAHELEAWQRLSSALHREYGPATESERQLVHKIIDCHTRLNRLAAIENNILNVGVAAATHPDSKNDDKTEAMVAQARCWTKEANTFEKLGRYESRISRQLLLYTKELDRIQTARRAQQTDRPNPRQTVQNKSESPKSASFRQMPAKPDAPVTHTPAPPVNGFVFSTGITAAEAAGRPS